MIGVRRFLAATTFLLVVGATSQARADSPKRDGYCDYVKGVAQAESSLLMAPELFSSFGYLDQLAIDSMAGSGNNDLRLTMGARYSFGNFYQGHLLRKRADADCSRQRALAVVNSGTTGTALEARNKVLADAMSEAEEMLSNAERDVESRRSTRQELISTRLRVEALRESLASSQRQLDALPAHDGERSLTNALTSYYKADGEVERHQAKLRSARGWDLDVRMGYDKFLANDDSSPFFAVVSARVNIGWFFQSSGNQRAAAGRRLISRNDQGMTGTDVTQARLRKLLKIDSQRADETGLLVSDLETQLGELRRIGGETTRRLVQTVWFEWVQARAEHEYLTTHVASLKEVLSGSE